MAGSGISRRRSLRWLAAATMAGAPPSVAADRDDPIGGAALYSLVRAYDGLGEHRAGTPADSATTEWLSKGLAAAGLSVAHQSFPISLFQPKVCRLGLEGGVIEAFPAWPPFPTAADGLGAPLAEAESSSVEGKIALATLPFRPGGGWAIPGYGDVVKAAIERGAVAVVAVTEGPTGEIIALNAVPDRFNWTAPVLMVAGRDAERLRSAAARGAAVTLVSRGDQDAGASAVNVIGRRPGRGKTVVVTTPKSGWFHCAGERGGGIALFLATARRLVRETDCDLLFGCSSAHEFNYLGSDYFFRVYAPPPHKTRLWLHLGANVAMQTMEVSSNGVTPLGQPAAGRLTVSARLMDAARGAFAGEPGYERPIALTPLTAVGELEVFEKGGYDCAVGMLGASPLFHTRLDRAELATSPAVLEGAERAISRFLRIALA